MYHPLSPLLMLNDLAQVESATLQFEHDFGVERGEHDNLDKVCHDEIGVRLYGYANR